jgi:hypothetical protein
MIVFRVSDLAFDRLSHSYFDLAVFASGYEERCTHLAEQLDLSLVPRRLLFGFSEHADASQRLANSIALESRIGVPQTMLAHDDERGVFEALNQIELPPKIPLEIFVDYSSMSRTWFNAILNYFKYGIDQRPVSLTFAYTVGEHQDLAQSSWGDETDFKIEEILCLPGLEGGPLRLHSTVAILGFGFEWIAPFSACEQLEPDLVYAFAADPGAFPDYGQAAIDRNSRFIAEYLRSKVLRLPLRSVEKTFRALAELILPFRRNSNVVLVPMGPKPHVLSCILLASRFREVSCLYAKGSRSRPIRVRAAAPDDVVLTRVELIPSDEAAPHERDNVTAARWHSDW